MMCLAIHTVPVSRRREGLRVSALLVALTASAGVARAAPLTPACARIDFGKSQSQGSNTTYTHVALYDAGNEGSLTATGEMLSGLDPADMEGVAGAASTLLLAAMTGHHTAACTDWLETEGRKVEAALGAGHSFSVSWSDVIIRHGNQQTTLAHAKLALAPQSDQTTATLTMDGITVRGIAAPSLMPTSASASFSLPQRELASLMAATAGKATSLPAVHVAIRSFAAQRDSIRLAGNGHATLTGNTDSTSAGGHLEVQDINTLIDHARQDGQMKIAAALILARMVSHSTTNGNAWDTTWEGGILTVNNVPLPIK